MPGEPRASAVQRALSVARRLTAVQAAGLVGGMMVAVVMLYAVSAAGAASTGSREPGGAPSVAAQAPRLQLGDGVPPATATVTASPTASPPLTPPTAPA